MRAASLDQASTLVTPSSACRDRPEPRDHRSAARAAIEIQKAADIFAMIACTAVKSAITRAAISIFSSALCGVPTYLADRS